MFSQPGACNALILFQYILASLSVYYLSHAARNLFESDTMFHLTFYLFLICPFSNFYDAYTCTESLCGSVLIFSVYFFSKYFQEHKIKYCFISGLLLTWVVFLRPIFGGLIMVCCIILLLTKMVEFRIRFKHVLIFLIPFIVCDGIWISRNYILHKEFIPLTSTAGVYPCTTNSYIEPLFEFGQSWGGVCSFTNGPSDIDWIDNCHEGTPLFLNFDSLPDDIYTSIFNKDSLLQLKKMIIALGSPSITPTTATFYQSQLSQKLTEYKLAIKREKPFLYFIKAPLKMIGVLLYGPKIRSILERGKSVPHIGGTIVSFNNIVYSFILFLGLISIPLLIIKGIKNSYRLWIVPIIPLYTLLVHPLLFRFYEGRYMIPVWSFMIVGAAYMVAWIEGKTHSKQH
jgi:hypothetical protein